MSAIENHGVLDTIPTLIRSLLRRHKFGEPAQPFNAVAKLSDRMLLDIGLDPRDIPDRGDAQSVRPELLLGDLTSPSHRQTAKY